MLVGFALIIEHLAKYGYTWQWELECHGLLGLFLVLVGFIVGALPRVKSFIIKRSI